MVTSTEISMLFGSVQKIIDHQEQLEKLKGERFNIFSVLKMERLENRTHSAFIAELLNPNGTHLRGNIFLSLFLQTINLIEYVDIDSAAVNVEFSIGERNDEAKTGGRIDIFIRDKQGKTISIENKIDAEDQFAQIERYCNYNKDNNTVVYLTLDGKEASKESAGNLVAGTDYKIVSYNDDIIDWLELCLKEAADFPMLRESIKQYLNLIKKMTSTPDDQHQKLIFEEILKNLPLANYINNNFDKARLFVCDALRNEVFTKLKSLLDLSEFEIQIGEPIHKKYAQIWIWHKAFPNATLHFGIETFNGNGNFEGDMFIGIFNSTGKENEFTKTQMKNDYNFWFQVSKIWFENTIINLSNLELVQKIYNQPDFKKKLVEYIAQSAYDFVNTHKETVLTHLKKSSK